MGKILIDGGLYGKSHNVPLKIPYDFYELIKTYRMRFQKIGMRLKIVRSKNHASGCEPGFTQPYLVEKGFTFLKVVISDQSSSFSEDDKWMKC